MVIWHSGARRGVVLSCLARQGFSWRGRVLRGRAQYGEALQCKLRRGFILALLGLAMSCPVKLGKAGYGFIQVLSGTVRSCPVWRGSVWLGILLRGMVLYGTVLSCPVRSCEARFCKAWFFEVWYGVAGRSPVRLGHVVFGSARLSKLWYFLCMVLLWFRDVLLGVAGRGRPAILSGVPFAKALSRFWYGTVVSCLARLCCVGQGLVSSWFGGVLQGIVQLGDVRLCMVRRR